MTGSSIRCRCCGTGPSEKLPPETPEAGAADVKLVATTFGADLVGICAHDERWVYTERFDHRTGGSKPNDLGDGLTVGDRDRPVDGP